MVGAVAGKALSTQQCGANGRNHPGAPSATQRQTYPVNLAQITPYTPLDADEIPITLPGTAFPPSRLAQQMMSILAEVGTRVPDFCGGPAKRRTYGFVVEMRQRCSCPLKASGVPRVLVKA